MKPGLQLRTSQNLTLSPQLQQAIRLLLLSTFELQQEVQEMIESNPFLDEDSSSEDEHTPTNDIEVTHKNDSLNEVSETQETTTSELSEMDWSQSNSTDSNLSNDDEWQITNEQDSDNWDNISGNPSRESNDSDSENDPFNTYAEDISLTDYLEEQTRNAYTTPEDSAALFILIQSLNENGYLESDIEDIASNLLSSKQDELDYELQYEALTERLTCVLQLLQTFDPPGIGARNLSECLTIQLKQLPQSLHRDLAIELCTNHLDDLARRDYRKMSADTKHAEDDVREAFQIIQTLNPKPGKQFSSEPESIIIPDVIAKKTRQGWQATLNPEVMPNIKINEIYANALRKHKAQDGKEAMGQRLQEARWFIKNIQQRFDTILRTSQAIIDRQKNFFTHGEMGMRPLVLREIAEELELHESTISRVTTAKYMQTPFGIYELKFFFGSGVSTESGGSASSTAVRALIKKLIHEENPKKPLSDNAISSLLEEQGIQVARRTVAKYRDELKIPTATLRRAI